MARQSAAKPGRAERLKSEPSVDSDSSPRTIEERLKTQKEDNTKQVQQIQKTLSNEENRQLDEECLQRFLKVNVRLMTDDHVSSKERPSPWNTRLFSGSDSVKSFSQISLEMIRFKVTELLFHNMKRFHWELSITDRSLWSDFHQNHSWAFFCSRRWSITSTRLDVQGEVNGNSSPVDYTRTDEKIVATVELVDDILCLGLIRASIAFAWVRWTTKYRLGFSSRTYSHSGVLFFLLI